MGSAISRLRRSSAPPPPAIPVEIWLAIFDQLEISDLVTLLRVSRFISEVVEAHSCRQIHVRTDQKPLPSVNHIRKRLASSKRSLYITIALQHWSNVELYCEPLIKLVAEHMHRVEYLSLTLPRSYGSGLLRDNLVYTPAPLLHTFVLQYTDCSDEDTCFSCQTSSSMIYIWLFRHHAPNLSRVHLHNVYLHNRAYNAFRNVRDLRVSSSGRSDNTLCLPVWPELRTLHIEGPFWRYQSAMIGERVRRERQNDAFDVTVSHMDGRDQERAVASLTTAQSGLVTVTSPSTETLKMLSVQLDDARSLYLIARRVNLPGSEELHLELGDADRSKTRRRVFMIDSATVNVAIDNFYPGVKQRISVLSLNCSEARFDALSLITQGQGKWFSCKSLCLTFDEGALGSFLSFFFGRRQVLDGDTFPALELLVICCTHPDLPPLKEAAMRLRIFVPALRALLSHQRLENVEIIYTRDPEVVLECTRGRELDIRCAKKWVYLW